jgi:signal transduction histidine kinase
VYTYKQAFKTPALFAGEYDGVIYFYSGNAVITGLHSRSFKTVSAYATGITGYEDDAAFYPKISKNIIDGTVAFIADKTIYTWNLQTGRLLFRSQRMPGISSFFLYMKSTTELLYYNYEPMGTLQVYQNNTGSSKALAVKGFEAVTIGRCNIYRWRDRWLFHINDRIFETDSSFLLFKNEMVNFQNQPPASGSIIVNIIEDNYGNLMLQTIMGGIKKIIRNNYPLKYFNTGEAGKNFIISVLPDKQQNRILAGASQNGLLVFDTLQRLIKHIKITGDNGRLISPNVMLKKPNGHYLLFAASERKIWELSSSLQVLKPVTIQFAAANDKTTVSYFGNFLWQTPEKALVQTANILYRINLADNKVQASLFSKAYIMGGIYHQGTIITHGYDELLTVDTASLSVIRKTPFKNTGDVRCFAQNGNGTVYAGTNKGIFVTDHSGKVSQQFSKETGLPDECIYAIAFDSEHNLWCSTNKGILKLKDGKLTAHLKKEDGLQENEFNTNVVAQAPDGELFFGGVNGVSSFYPADIAEQGENAGILFTRIMANNQPAIADTAAWNLQQIALPYTKNALAFDFVAMGSYNPDQYLYQYRMEGVDKEWIQTNGMQTVRYSLSPGTYVFKIFASRIYDNNATPVKELLIIIHPPFWKTWWFTGLFGAAVLLVFGYAVNRRNTLAFAKQLQQMENEKQLKEERERISKDLHDSLGAYANAVLYNTEMLEKENTEQRGKEILNDLKFASKDIITSLRETVWALKKENYTAEDCLVRIRNFIQPLARYYSHISFNLEGEAPPEITLHYTKALHLVRIVQEAVTNSIKHARPAHITVSSSNGNNRWTVKIADDGIGFNTAAMTEEKGNGVHNMKFRAAASGVDLTIESYINNGTQIIITV